MSALQANARDTGQVMLKVVYALIPAVLAHYWLFGWGIVLNVALAAIFALGFEALSLLARGRDPRHTLIDNSALLSGVLLAIALPPMSQWWLLLVGTFFTIVVAKQLYGGLGFNPFNPAMVGYVVLLISFPVDMTHWLPPIALRGESLSLIDALSYVFGGQLPNGMQLDALTMATPLDVIRTQIGLHHTVGEAMSSSPVFGLFGGKQWEIFNGLILLGGLWMVWAKVIRWHIPVAVLGTLMLVALSFHLYDADRFAGPLFHLFSGGAIFGAFFIATDPVSAATSDRGRLIFGFGVGLLEYIIRVFGGYPDGIAFSVLLMNMAAPTIDYYTKPRTFGHGAKE